MGIARTTPAPFAILSNAFSKPGRPPKKSDFAKNAGHFSQKVPALPAWLDVLAPQLARCYSIVMRAAFLRSPGPIEQFPLTIGELPEPLGHPGHVLLRVRACGVCRTDLHIVEGELPIKREPLIAGHQIVGEVIDGATAELPLGTRVGVSWIGGVDGSCWYCQHGLENLCDGATFTGYSVDGGYAEYALVRSDFVFPLPDTLDDLRAAPLLCAGIIGFRSLRVAGVEHGERVGLFGFGASAHL